MNRFAWSSPRDVAQAAAAASTTVAGAMTSQSGEPSADGAVLKGGGIDLFDLMKEGLLTPRHIVNLRDLPGLDRIAPADGGERMGDVINIERDRNRSRADGILLRSLRTETEKIWQCLVEHDATCGSDA